MVSATVSSIYQAMPKVIEGSLSVSTEIGTEYVPIDVVQRGEELNDFVQGEHIFDVSENLTNWLVYSGSRWMVFPCVTTAREFAEGVIG